MTKMKTFIFWENIEKRERKLLSFFFGCNFGQTIGRGSSDSRRIKSDQRILGKTIAPILGASQ